MFEVLTILVERRFLVLAVTLLTAAVAARSMFTEKDLYTSSALAMASQPSVGPSRFDAISSQLGLGGGGVGGVSPSSPSSLGALAKSSVILGRLLDDTVRTTGGPPTLLRDFVVGVPKPNAGGRTEALRRDVAIKVVRGWVSVGGGGIPGSVVIEVTTPWPEVSAEIAGLLLNQLDRWNREWGQRSAGVERTFLEERLAEQSYRLTSAEARMTSFLEANRQIGSSPQLAFERDRLQREVSLHQQVLVGLLQSREDTRLREVRDTPVLTVIEAPKPPLEADPRQGSRRLILGLIAGFFLGSLIAFLLSAFSRERIDEDPEIRRFVAVVVGALVPSRLLARFSRRR